MNEGKQNYYGSLCTEMYEILHREAPQDELEFYLSYAQKGMSILEPLCGSGRFLIPFLERGYDISGMDLSAEMLAKLKDKVPDAKVFQTDILKFETNEKFDYIFISSGPVSLVLKSKNYYDVQSQTQFSPSVYELYDGTNLLQREPMDF